jgi:hypothetical protein
MTTLSYSQQHLLKVLQITPVQLANVFAVPASAEYSSTSQSMPSDISAEDKHLPLTQDVTTALPDSLQWQIDPAATQSHIRQQQLLTPPLQVLQQAEQKKALWAVLSRYEQI